MFLIIILYILLITWFLVYIKSLISNKFKEGLDNPVTTTSVTTTTLSTTPPLEPLPTNQDPLQLATTNSNNIATLKSQVDTLIGLKQQVTDISGQVLSLTTTVNGLSTQLSSNVSSATGCDPNNPTACPLSSVNDNGTSSA
jgi:hypothetical protein